MKTLKALATRKSVMKKHFMILLSAMLLCLAMASTALAAEPGIISVDGSGEYTVAPDKAVISLSVETKDKTVELTRAANAAQSARLSAALSRMGNKTVTKNLNKSV